MSSPPKSMPSPVSLWRLRLGLVAGGIKVSKLSRLRAELTARGVLAVAGVFGHCAWAGLGVTLQKSAKLKLLEGVLGNPKRPVLPGVFMMEDGRGVDLGGGVDGAIICVRFELPAGVGEVARNMRRSAPSSPVLGVLDQETFDSLLTRRRCGGGVRGGEDAMKDC